MNAQHTPARMKFVGNRGLRDADGKLFAVLVGDNFDQMEGDARRLAACWNACEGITTERLEDLGRPLMQHLIGCDERAARMVQERRELESKRDELLAERDALQARTATDFVEHQRELSKALDQRDELLAALRPLITKRMGAEQIREGIQRAIAKATGENT